MAQPFEHLRGFESNPYFMPSQSDERIPTLVFTAAQDFGERVGWQCQPTRMGGDPPATENGRDQARLIRIDNEPHARASRRLNGSESVAVAILLAASVTGYRFLCRRGLSAVRCRLASSNPTANHLEDRASASDSS